MKKNNFWFSLIELLVVIAIIWILALSISNFDFNKWMDKQYLLQYKNDIFTLIEKTRNDSLLWKSLSWNLLIIPNERRITITTNNTTNSWSVKLTNWSWSTDIWYSENINIPKFFSVNNLSCLSSTITIIDLIFSWPNLSYSWWCLTNFKSVNKLNIEVKYKSLTWSIIINPITNIIEKN